MGEERTGTGFKLDIDGVSWGIVPLILCFVTRILILSTICVRLELNLGLFALFRNPNLIPHNRMEMIYDVRWKVAMGVD